MFSGKYVYGCKNSAKHRHFDELLYSRASIVYVWQKQRHVIGNLTNHAHAGIVQHFGLCITSEHQF